MWGLRIVVAVSIGCLAVWGGVTSATELEPTVVVAVAPWYSSLAIMVRYSGEVRLGVDVGPDGVPTKVAVVSGHPVADDVSVYAARRWRFRGAGHVALRFVFKMVPEDACQDEVLPRYIPPYTVEVAQRSPLACPTCRRDETKELQRCSE